MSDSTKAVFLSYASQDMEAAKKICDALRAAGVEVWFDAEGGLEHGDEWDQKIRRQIKECVLFIPIISANTQAREEGYFRIEWDLAAERARGIASGVAFILPVVIDATREPDALVPDRFRKVQWTKLPGGAVPPEVLQRFLKLWSHRTGALKHEASQASAAPDHTTVPRSPRRRVAVAASVVGVLAVAFAAGAFFLFRPTATKDSVPPVPAATPSPESLSEARKLAQRARAVFDATTVVRQDMELAEQLVQKAEALDPTDAYVWAVAAQVHAGFVLFAYDSSDTRVGQALTKAERAFRMAPDLFEARLAKAFVLTYSPAPGSPPSPEAGRLVEALLKEQPANRRVLLIQGMIMQGEGRWDEAARVYRLAHDRWAEGWALLYAGRLAEVEAVAEDGLKAGQSAGDRVAGAGDVRQALMLLLSLNLRAREDLKATQAVMDRMPPDELREEETACYAADLYLMQRQPEKVLEIMRALPRDWLVPRGGEGPYKASYSALAHQMANHPEAAGIEWRAALKLVEERLATRPNAPGLVLWKARLLARLGERAEAERLLQLYEQMQGRTRGEIHFDAIDTYLVLGRREEVLAALPKAMANPFVGFWFHAYLRFDPTYDPLRGDPRFEAVLRQYLPKLAKPLDEPPPAAATSVIDGKSVAVLPFENRSAGGEDAAFFADGIHEDLINTLSRVPGLRVMARTAVERFRAAKTALPEIAATLKVTHVVEAGVQRAGNQVRVNVQLVSAADGQTAWSERYDRVLSAGGIFALQEEITAAIAQALQLRLKPEQLTNLIAGTTKNMEAYEAFLKGRQIWKTPGVSDRLAVAQFQRAVELDPNFALAYGAMAEAYITLGNIGDELPSRIYPLAKAAAERALAIDPRCIQALTALGEYAFHYEWDWDKSERLLREALQVDPNYASAYSRLSGHLTMLNRPAEAELMEKRNAELEPASPFGRLRRELGEQLEAKNFPAAVATARQIATRVPAGYLGPLILSNTLRAAGQFSEAVPLLEKAVRENPDSLILALELGLSYAASGQEAEARDVMNRLGVIRGTRYVSPLIFARLAAALQDRDLAFAEIERAFQLHDSNLPDVPGNDELASLRGDLRFREILRRLRLDTVFPEVARQ